MRRDPVRHHDIRGAPKRPRPEATRLDGTGTGQLHERRVTTAPQEHPLQPTKTYHRHARPVRAAAGDVVMNEMTTAGAKVAKRNFRTTNGTMAGTGPCC